MYLNIFWIYISILAAGCENSELHCGLWRALTSAPAKCSLSNLFKWREERLWLDIETLWQKPRDFNLEVASAFFILFYHVILICWLKVAIFRVMMDQYQIKLFWAVWFKIIIIMIIYERVSVKNNFLKAMKYSQNFKDF